MDWDNLNYYLTQLSRQISLSPDVIIGITRGGIIPARILATKLKVGPVYTLTLKKLGKDRKVVTEITENLENLQVLLVEDMLESGQSLATAKAYLETKGARVKTASLYIMPKTKIKPDYYLKQVKQVVRFPWE